MYFLLEE